MTRRTAPRPTKLAPFEGYLRERIEAAHPAWIPATVLKRELEERGYDGGISQLKEFLRPLKPNRPDPVVRFETSPGEQLQADFTYVRKAGVSGEPGAVQPQISNSLCVAGNQSCRHR